MTTSTVPAIFASFADIDTLAQPPVATVKGSALREGMVLVDELDCPAVGIDHRVRAPRGSGAVAFLVADLDNGGWRTMNFGANSTLRVVGR